MTDFTRGMTQEELVAALTVPCAHCTPQLWKCPAKCMGGKTLSEFGEAVIALVQHNLQISLPVSSGCGCCPASDDIELTRRY